MHATYYWNVSTKPGKWDVMYICVLGIDFASFYDCSIGYSNCSNSLVVFVFILLLPFRYILLLPFRYIWLTTFYCYHSDTIDWLHFIATIQIHLIDYILLLSFRYIWLTTFYCYHSDTFDWLHFIATIQIHLIDYMLLLPFRYIWLTISSAYNRYCYRSAYHSDT